MEAKRQSIKYIDIDTFDASKIRLLRLVKNDNVEVYSLQYNYDGYFDQLRILVNNIQLEQSSRSHRSYKLLPVDYHSMNEDGLDNPNSHLHDVFEKIINICHAEGVIIYNLTPDQIKFEWFNHRNPNIKYNDRSKIVLLDSKTNQYKNRYLTTEELTSLLQKKISNKYHYDMNCLLSFSSSFIKEINSTTQGMFLTTKVVFGEIKLNKANSIPVIKLTGQQIEQNTIKDMIMDV